MTDNQQVENESGAEIMVQMRELFSQLSPRGKTLIVREFSQDSKVSAGKDRRRRAEQQEGMSRLEHASYLAEESFLCLNGFSTQYRSRPIWLTNAMQNGEKSQVEHIAATMLSIAEKAQELSAFLKRRMKRVYDVQKD